MNSPGSIKTSLRITWEVHISNLMMMDSGPVWSAARQTGEAKGRAACTMR